MVQHMADLPRDRTETPAPFTNVGFDVFGPWLIRIQNSEEVAQILRDGDWFSRA